jgi:hypothetical protein
MPTRPKTDGRVRSRSLEWHKNTCFQVEKPFSLVALMLELHGDLTSAYASKFHKNCLP